MGIVIAGVAAVLQYLIDEESAYAPEFPHHYSMLSLGGIVGFAVLFRTNKGWSRYWEAIHQLHLMYSKWNDTFMQLIAFASVSAENARASKSDAGDAKVKRIEETVESVYQNFATLSAVAADRLMHGDTNRMERRTKTGVAWRDQLVKREVLRGGPDLTGARQMPKFNVAVGTESEEYGHVNSRLTARASMTQVNSQRRTSMEDLQNTWKATSYRVRQLPTDTQYEVLEGSSDRTSVIMYWIVHDLAKVSSDLEAAPPIQSRMYQQLSDGMAGFCQACKLSDVPFPFPYAQMLTLLLVCYACFIPVYIVCFTSSMIAGPIMSFALFQGIWGLNETAKELENPFGTDENDITLGDFHLRFLDGIDQVFSASTLRSGMKAAASEARRYMSAQRSRGSDDIDVNVKDIPPQPAVQPLNRTGPRPRPNLDPHHPDNSRGTPNRLDPLMFEKPPGEGSPSRPLSNEQVILPCESIQDPHRVHISREDDAMPSLGDAMLTNRSNERESAGVLCCS
jgi:predicted membrane chloride channel (bestrophin family)